MITVGKLNFDTGSEAAIYVEDGECGALAGDNPSREKQYSGGGCGGRLLRVDGAGGKQCDQASG